MREPSAPGNTPAPCLRTMAVSRSLILRSTSSLAMTTISALISAFWVLSRAWRRAFISRRASTFLSGIGFAASHG